MTPNKRLDQMEPLMADVLQKVDRLIEGHGQLVEVATRADQNAETAARGIATLTVTTQKQFEQINNRFDQVDANQNEMRQDINGIRQDINGMREDIVDLKAGQELILHILREKLP